MSGALWSLVGKRVLAESARNHFGTEVGLLGVDSGLTNANIHLSLGSLF